jgi:hypothetical protein
MSKALSNKSAQSTVIKRSGRRTVGVFVDGPGLDRATRRLNKRIDFSQLLRGVSSGSQAVVARYYTVIPREDDSRHYAYLDAVRAAGFQVVVKRLPPKGVTRNVTIEPEMVADIIAFGFGLTQFPDNLEISDESMAHRRTGPRAPETPEATEAEGSGASGATGASRSGERRQVTVVCPSRELAYPLWLLGESGIDTMTADFGSYMSGDVMKSAAKWLDLSDSEIIWRP